VGGGFGCRFLDDAVQQILLKNVNIQGRAQFGQVTQIREGIAAESSQQQALVDVEVGVQGNFTLGDVEQKS